MINVNEAIRLVEEKSGYKVIKCFHFKQDYYLCVVTDPRQDYMYDPFYTVNKRTKSVCVFIPASDPKSFRDAVVNHEIGLTKLK